MLRRARLLAFSAALALTLGGSGAWANGKFPSALQLVADPADPQHLVMRTTFGLLTSRDGGQAWDWICEEAAGYQNTEPSVAMLTGGDVFVGVSGGIQAAGVATCAFAQDPGAIAEHVVQDVSARGSLAIAITSENGASKYWESQASALGWAQVGADLPAGITALTVDVAPSDPARIYVSGLLEEAGLYQGVVLRSGDHGATWSTTEITGSDVYDAPYLAAIHPRDPDQIFLRLDGLPGRLMRSSDGGASFEEVFAGEGWLQAFALSPAGDELLVGGPLDGLWQANVDALEFTLVSEVRSKCVTWTRAGVYSCGDEAVEGFFLGFSADHGATFSPLLHLPCVRGPLACGPETTVGAVCPPLWDAVATQLNTASCPGDGGAPSATTSTTGGVSGAETSATSGTPPGPPLGAGAQRDSDVPGSSAGCGCATTPRQAPPGAFALALLALWLRRRPISSPWGAAPGR